MSVSHCKKNIGVLAATLLLWFVPFSSFAEKDSYKIISEKNLFRPDRSEWVIEKKDTIPKNEIDPDQFELFGTLIVGDEKKALIYKEKPKKKGRHVRKSKSKSRRSRNRKDAEFYSPGDYIGEYVISEIEEKEVVLDYFGETVTLNLHEGKEPGIGEVTPLEVKKPKTRRKPMTKSKSRSKKGKVSARRKARQMERQLAAGKIPKELANNPFMSKETLKQVMDFNKEIMSDLRESGGTLDQAAIKEKVEAFRERFMSQM